VTALEEFAPWPKRSEDVTADSLSRWLAVQAHANRTLLGPLPAASDDVGRAHWITDVDFLLDEYGIVMLLRVLRSVNKMSADSAAKALWRAWEDGAEVDANLRDWLTGYGIDPDEVTAAAQKVRDEAKTAPKETTHA
jgi:hypothetical protein